MTIEINSQILKQINPPRTKVDGISIGCPTLSGDAPCHPCAGGWPGTKMSSKDLINAAKSGKLKPERLGCGMLQMQGEFLKKKFSSNGNNKC